MVEDAVPRSRLGYFADTDTAAAADIQTSLLPTGDAGSAGSAEPVLVRMMFELSTDDSGKETLALAGIFCGRTLL